MTSEASYENTSTTSCMSDSGSVQYANQSYNNNFVVDSSAVASSDEDASNINGHIGEIDERQFMLVAPPSSARSMLSDPTNLQYYVLNDSISSSSTNDDDKYYELSNEGNYNQIHSANRWYRQERVANNVTATASDTGERGDCHRDNRIGFRDTLYNYHRGDEDSSIMVDSVTEGIRNHIWEQVHQAKKKKQCNKITIQTQGSQEQPSGSSSNQTHKRNHLQRDPDGRRLDAPAYSVHNYAVSELAEKKMRYDDDCDGVVSDDHQSSIGLGSTQHFSTIVNMTNELIISDDDDDDDDDNIADENSYESHDNNGPVIKDDFANVKAVRDSIALLRTARAFTKSRDDSSSMMVQLEPQSHRKDNLNLLETKKSNPWRRSASALLNAPSDEVWDVQDDIASLIFDKHDAVVTAKATSANLVTPVTQEMQETDSDSLFDSILALELEEQKAQQSAAAKGKKTNAKRNLKKLKKPNHTSKSKDPPEEKNTALSDIVVRVCVHGSKEKTILYIPVILMQKRETEMKERARAIGLGEDQWNGSLLGRKVLSDNKEQPELLTLELRPEISCAEENYSQTFVWQPWLNECIESFYKTGSMLVPDCCVGSDLLVALQYFEILYTPNQLLFDSFSTYLRVKLWSEYYTHRGTIAEWLVYKLYQSHGKHTHVFSTCPYPLHNDSLVNTGNHTAEFFDGGISLDKQIYGDTPSSTVLYSFFNEDDENEEPSNMDMLMREDFCNYFGKLVPGIDVTFPTKTTTIHHSNDSTETLQLATLYIRLKKPDQSRNQDLFHIEEESSLVSEATKSHSPVAQRSLLSACHNKSTFSLQQCFLKTKTKLTDFDQSPGGNWASPDTWLPVQNPESVAVFSLDNCKDSNALDGWMSSAAKHQKNSLRDNKNTEGIATDDWWTVTTSPLPPKKVKAKSDNRAQSAPRKYIKNLIDSASESPHNLQVDTAKRQQVKKLTECDEKETARSPHQTSHAKTQLNIDHIYEDLWLQETTFDESPWASSDLGVNQSTTKKSKKHVKSTKHTKWGKNDTGGSRRQKKTRTTSREKGRPDHLLCDAVGMFEDSSVGSRNQVDPRRRPDRSSKPIPGVDFPDDEDHF